MHKEKGIKTADHRVRKAAHRGTEPGQDYSYTIGGEGDTSERS